MRLYLKPLAACVLIMAAFTTHAGLLDDLGSALGGDAKKETSQPDTTSATNNPSRNLVSAPATGSTGKRVALVIGNGNYQHTGSLPKLANPGHDAEDIAKALRKFGFEVIEKKDLSLEGMNEAITEFGRKITDSDAALFYFAGHGLQVKGQNYLVPTNAKIESESQVPYQSINVNQLLDEMDNGKSRANIVMLDACRNNPISGKFRSGATRGLAAPTSQPKGTVIVYATDPGNVAADGSGRNGLFTAGLLTAFKGGDLSLRGVLVRASKEVELGSGQKQTPYINGPATLQEEFCFAGCASGTGTQVASLVPIPAQPVRIKSKEEIEDDTWNAAEAENSLEAIQTYLSGYPKGRYVTQAQIKLTALKKQPQETKPVEPIAAPVIPVREDNDTALWNEAQKGGAAEDYRAYLGQYPKGKYTALAKARLKKLDDEAAQQAAQQEQSAWDSANNSGSESGYQSYLNSYPKGRFAALASARIAKLKKEAAQAAANGPKAGTIIRDCPDCPEMVVIPAGSFEMGETGSTHQVTLKKFALGKTEVTQGQWRAIMGGNPSYFKNCGDTCPVEQVSWNDIQEFIQKLNSKTGKQYRLPSEAEWEYACRAGARQEYCGGGDINGLAWYGAEAEPVGNSAKATNRVATKQANAFGLHDMSGNVWEWVEDSWHDNYNGAPNDGSAWQGDGAKRVLRGGSWFVKPQVARATVRDGLWPAERGLSSGLGFRLARMLP